MLLLPLLLLFLRAGKVHCFTSSCKKEEEEERVCGCWGGGGTGGGGGGTTFDGSDMMGDDVIGGVWLFVLPSRCLRGSVRWVEGGASALLLGERAEKSGGQSARSFALQRSSFPFDRRLEIRGVAGNG